jgi:hypothetical protein
MVWALRSGNERWRLAVDGGVGDGGGASMERGDVDDEMTMWLKGRCR